MKIKFREVKLSKLNKIRLDQINSIIREYQDEGYVLTLRQLYYQLVSRDVIPNQQKEYAKLSNLLKEGRMGGIVDWNSIEDRLRRPYSPPSWNSPKEIIESAASQYMKPRMEGQEKYIEVWVEKDALSGVLKRVTSKYHIPILVNRGYSSISAMFDSYKRFKSAITNGQECVVLYLGDFDPSGVDMIRDIKDRTTEFLVKDYIDSYETKEDKKKETEERSNYFREWINQRFSIVPIALTEEQIEQYDPPPNPAKITDPRAEKYISKHGRTSWEVDALRPEVLNQVLTDAIEERIDLKLYNKIISEEKKDKTKLANIIKDFK